MKITFRALWLIKKINTVFSIHEGTGHVSCMYARWALGKYEQTASVTEMLKVSNWRSLEQRRADARLSLLYKLANNLVAVDPGVNLRSPARISRHKHSFTPISTSTNFTDCRSTPVPSPNGTPYHANSFLNQQTIPIQPQCIYCNPSLVV